jgi:hypothetical protein
VTGVLRRSLTVDFYLEADCGGYWMLDVAPSMAPIVDRLLHAHVLAEGLRSGFANLVLMRIDRLD